MRRTGVRVVRTAKDPRFVGITVVLVACALIAGLNIGSDEAYAQATGPLNIRGFVWDEYWNAVEGANVTVRSFDGVTLVGTEYFDATEPDGFYQVTFAEAKWDIGYGIEITAAYGIYSGVNDTIAVEQVVLPYQWLNVTLEGLAIPEFSGGAMLVSTVMCLAVIVIYTSSKKRRGA